MSTVLDLKTLNLKAGVHNVTVKAKGVNWLDSNSSGTASYTVALATPFITLNGAVVSFPVIPGATSYRLYVGGNLADESEENTFDLAVILSNAEAGDYKITVKAVCPTLESEPSNEVTYTIVPEIPQIPSATIELDGDTLKIYDDSGLASYATIYVDGVAKHTLSTGLIGFTIEGTPYRAKEGMTWAEWLTSDYNTVNAVSMGLNLGYDGKRISYLRDSGYPSPVMEDEEIIAGYAYVRDSGGGSND